MLFHVPVNNGETFANSKPQSVLSMESTKSVPNFPSFLVLLKTLDVSLIEKVSLISMLSIMHCMPKYIGRATTCIFYAMSQNNIYIVIKPVNKNKMFIVAIKKKTYCHS